MSIQTSTNNGENNAILVSRELVEKLRSAVAQRKGPYDRLPSDRMLLDAVLQQMVGALAGRRIYCTTVPKQGETYKYFGSDVVSAIRKQTDIMDLGRFVDACIVAYLWGDAGLARYCVGSKVVYPQKLDDEKLARIVKKAAEIADSESVESKFIPTSYTLVD